MGQPQFDTQDDAGIGDGIPPIPDWYLDLNTLQDNPPSLSHVEFDGEVRKVFLHLRSIFHRAQIAPLLPTRLHDLTCFVVHRLMASAAGSGSAHSSPATECMRLAIVLYMFIIQGPTYYSHAVIFNTIVDMFSQHLKELESMSHPHSSLFVWFWAIGIVASTGTVHHRSFIERAKTTATYLQLAGWDDVLVHVKNVLWLETPQVEYVFRAPWEPLLSR